MIESTSLRTAEALLREHLALITHHHDRWLALFADDAVVEFPYAASLGRSTRLEGKAAIDEYFRGGSAAFRGLSFRDVRVHVSTDADSVVAEAHGSAHIVAKSKPYEQDYVMVLTAKGGRITSYREYWNPLPAIEAFGGMGALAKPGFSS